MGDCPGAGSGDPRDYDRRSTEQIRDANIAKVHRWIKKKGFEKIEIGYLKKGDYFVNYPIDEKYIRDCQFYFFEKDSRKILKAEVALLYGTTKVVPLNFNAKYRYYIVKRKSKKSLNPNK